MESIVVSICAGTACVVMDGSQLALLEEHLPPHLKGRVKLRGERCLDLCHAHGASHAPFVRIQGEPMEQATLERIAARIEALLAEGD